MNDYPTGPAWSLRKPPPRVEGFPFKEEKPPSIDYGEVRKKNRETAIAEMQAIEEKGEIPKEISGLAECFREITRGSWTEIIKLAAVTDPKAAKMMEYIGLNSHKKSDLPRRKKLYYLVAASHSGVEIGDLSRWVQQWAEEVGKLIGAQRTPGVIQKIATEALKGDRKSQKMFLEMRGLLGKNGGLQVNVPVYNLPGPVSDVLSRAQAALERPAPVKVLDVAPQGEPDELHGSAPEAADGSGQETS